MFKELSMGKNNINMNKSGSGLGLNICKKIVEKLGGVISLKSSPEKGTTVTFNIKPQKICLKFSENEDLDFIDNSNTERK